MTAWTVISLFFDWSLSFIILWLHFEHFHNYIICRYMQWCHFFPLFHRIMQSISIPSEKCKSTTCYSKHSLSSSLHQYTFWLWMVPSWCPFTHTYHCNYIITLSNYIQVISVVFLHNLLCRTAYQLNKIYSY
jgi:hypothetical protein